MPYTIDQVKQAFLAADEKARSGDETARADAAMFAGKLREMQTAPMAQPVNQIETRPTQIVPESVIAFQKAIVPGKPLDSIINGFRAAQMWAKENKGVIADMAIEGGGPAIGQRIAGPVGGFVGGVTADSIAQARQMSNNPNQQFSGGRALGAGVVAAFPLKSLVNAQLSSVAKESTKQALVNLAAEVVQTGIDKHELPSADQLSKAASTGVLSVGIARTIDAGKLASKESIRAGEASFKDETYLLAHQNGYLLDPEISNPSVSNKTLTAIGGESQIQSLASKHNQTITDRLARDQIGVQPGVAIEPMEIRQKEYDVAKPYRQLSALDPIAANAVAKWKEANFKAKRFWKSFKDSGNPEAYDRAIIAEAEVQAHADTMDNMARLHGSPGLIRDIEEARKQLAILHAYDSSINQGTGQIDARVIGAMLDAKAPLTGNLEIIGRFQQASPQVMGSPTQASSATRITRLGMYGGSVAGGAIIGGAAGAAVGSAIGAIAPMIARKTALSQSYQALNYLPKYSDNADVMANVARFATQSLGR